MNGRRAKQLRREAAFFLASSGADPAEQGPSYPVVRTRPLIHVDDRGRTRLVGHGCDDPRVVLTAGGNESVPYRSPADAADGIPTRLHHERLMAFGRRGLVDRVRDLIRRDAA